MSYTALFTERNWFALVIPFSGADGNRNSNYYDMEIYHRGVAFLQTGAVAAGEDIRIAIYAATDGAGTSRTLVKQMTAAQAVNGNNDTAVIEFDSSEIIAAVANAKFIRVEATATGTPEYWVNLNLFEPRYPPVDATHYDRRIT